MDVQVIRKALPKEYLHVLLKNHGLRSDGRASTENRKLTISTASISSPLASAMVRLGKTTVLAGINATIHSSRDDPKIDVQAYMTPLCSPDFHPMREDPLLSSKITNALISYVDVASLSLQHLKHENDFGSSQDAASHLASSIMASFWKLHISLYCLDDDGSILDTALIAALAALKTCKLPHVQKITNNSGDDEYIAIHPPIIPLKLNNNVAQVVASFALCRIGINKTDNDENHSNMDIDTLSNDLIYLADPTKEEQQAADSILSVYVYENGRIGKIDKPGGIPLNQIILPSILETAREKAKQSFEAINKLQ